MLLVLISPPSTWAVVNTLRLPWCWELREFLLGHGPNGSPRVDPEVGSPQSDIFYHYETTLIKAIALDKATRQEEKQARREKRAIDPDNIDRLTQRYLTRIPYKSTGSRYHSFVVYFSNLVRLGWVEETGREEPSAFQERYLQGCIPVDRDSRSQRVRDILDAGFTIERGCRVWIILTNSRVHSLDDG